MKKIYFLFFALCAYIISTGNNINSCNFLNNPISTFIQVDNISDSNSIWSDKANIKITKSKSRSLSAEYTIIPDVNFETKLISLGIDSGTVDGKVLTLSIE
jgi:hypothetical protein